MIELTQRAHCVYSVFRCDCIDIFAISNSFMIIRLVFRYFAYSEFCIRTFCERICSFFFNDICFHLVLLFIFLFYFSCVTYRWWFPFELHCILFYFSIFQTYHWTKHRRILFVIFDCFASKSDFCLALLSIHILKCTFVEYWIDNTMKCIRCDETNLNHSKYTLNFILGRKGMEEEWKKKQIEPKKWKLIKNTTVARCIE